jgi:hypothetical protein
VCRRAGGLAGTVVLKSDPDRAGSAGCSSEPLGRSHPVPSCRALLAVSSRPAASRRTDSPWSSPRRATRHPAALPLEARARPLGSSRASRSRAANPRRAKEQSALFLVAAELHVGGAHSGMRRGTRLLPSIDARVLNRVASLPARASTGEPLPVAHAGKMDRSARRSRKLLPEATHIAAT